MGSCEHCAGELKNYTILCDNCMNEVMKPPPVRDCKCVENTGYTKQICTVCNNKFCGCQMLGGGQIADTGDYDDCYCPHCGSVEVEDDDNEQNKEEG